MPHDPGWCKDCRVEPTEGSSRCEACRAARAERARQARAAARAAGVCGYLGCPRRAARGRTYCRAHLGYYASANREHRRRAARTHLVAASGRTYCGRLTEDVLCVSEAPSCARCRHYHLLRHAET